MLKFKYIIISISFFIYQTSISQTIYGVSGIIKTPNAYTVDDGKCNMGLAVFKDYNDNSDELLSQWTANLNIGFHQRLEVGVRLAIFPGWDGDTKIFNASFDRILSGKYLLMKEKKVLPHIAIGMQDIVGTRYHNSTYLVASKSIQIKKTFSLLMNVGYGSKISDLIFGDAYNHHFIGLFGGAEIGYRKRIFLMTEYDARDVNSGLKITVNDWLNFNFSLLKMEILSAGFSLKFTL